MLLFPAGVTNRNSTNYDVIVSDKEKKQKQKKEKTFIALRCSFGAKRILVNYLEGLTDTNVKHFHVHGVFKASA